jgi:hypothetical protein
MKSRIFLLVLVVAVLAWSSTCGNGSSGSKTGGAISVAFYAPPPSSMEEGATALVAATVSNDPSNQVTWSCTPAGSCGSFNPTQTVTYHNTTYTAPSSVGTVTITATSVTDNTKSANASVSIVLPILVSLTTPPPSSMLIGTKANVTATVSNDPANAGVNWSCAPAGLCGSFSPAQTPSGTSATYTAPSSVPSGVEVAITAASVTDGTKTASGTVTIQPPGIVGDCGSAGDIDYVMVYQSQLSEWCVDTNFYSANYTTFYSGPFFAYSDAVIKELHTLFPVTPPNQPFLVEVKAPFGGASTGCDFAGGSYCNTVTGDAYYNGFNDPVTGASIRGFWGYLLTLHEAINVHTGMVSGGWPTDWWADDRSPFPNAFDYEIMQAIGTAQNNSTLLLAATAQKNRYDNQSQNPSGYDPEVAMFINFFNQFCQGSPCSGFPAYTNAFTYVVGDGISWPSVSGDTDFAGDNDYSAQLSEYVIAYLQTGFGTTTDQTPTFASAGVGSAANTPSGESPYTVDPTAVWDIAAAHCSIQAAKGAGQPYSQQLANLQSGNYQNAIATGGTQATCPSECTWSASQSQCVPLWPHP